MLVHRKSVNGELVSFTIDGVPQPLDGEPRVVANALGATARVASAVLSRKKITVSAEEKERRVAICRTCEFFRDNPMKCLKCGCYLNLKTRLETEHCPIEKW